VPTLSETLFFLQSSRNSLLLFTRVSARLKHSLSLQTKINDMNTSSYSREPPSPKRATPQNASVGEKVSHPSGNPQLGRKAKVGPIYYPNSLPGPTVDELLQRLNGNAPPTKTIGRKAPGIVFQLGVFRGVPVFLGSVRGIPENS